MICDDICYLIAENPQAHGVFDAPDEGEIPVFCQVLSVSRSEYWHALQNGIEPSFVLRFSEYADYHGEKLLRFRGKRWRVIRTYVTDHSVELTIGEVTADA